MPAAIIILKNESAETWLTAAENIDQLVEMFCGHFEDKWKVYRTEKLSHENMLPEYYNGDDKLIEEKLSGSNVKELLCTGENEQKKQISEETLKKVKSYVLSGTKELSLGKASSAPPCSFAGISCAEEARVKSTVE